MLHTPPDQRSTRASFVRFFVVLALLIAPWPGLGRTVCKVVGTIVTSVADPLLASTNITLLCRATRASDGLPEWDAVLSVRQDSPDGPEDHGGAMDMRRAGYLQAGTWLALVAGWPPRGGRRVLRSLSIFAAILLIVVALPIVTFLMSAGVLDASAVVESLVSLASRALVGAPAMAYAVPGLAWLFLVQGVPLQDLIAKVAGSASNPMQGHPDLSSPDTGASPQARGLKRPAQARRRRPK
jgi:hypothetical protein